MATNLKKIVEDLKTSVDEYENIQQSNDISKKEALEIITKETALISNVEKREHDQDIQKQEFELKKDHQYFVENQDKEKLKIEKDRVETEKKKVQNEDNKNQEQVKLEQHRFDLEVKKFDYEKEMTLLRDENDRKERIFKYVTFGVSTLLSFLGIIIPVMTYRKLALMEMHHTYLDEGRTTKQFEEFTRNVKPKVQQ